MSIIRNCLLSFLLLSFTHSVQAEIHLEVFQGENIAPYVDGITDIALNVYSEYPYLYEGTIEEYHPFIEYYTTSSDGIACLIFDDQTPVGVAIGMPIKSMREKYKLPFSKTHTGDDLNDYYYLGEFLLLDTYRKKGYGREMYRTFEEKVKELDYIHHICLCKIEEPRIDAEQPSGYKPLDSFWEMNNYQQIEDTFTNVLWPEVGQAGEVNHKLVYWIKTLN